jgi:ribosomal protein S18 acetylase RimI-like enzyme
MIRALVPDDAERCDAIIRSLPDWFGNDQGIAECAAAVRAQPGLVEVADGEVAGFLTWKQHHPASAEITWLAVHPGHRGRGVGTALVEELARTLDGTRFLLVKTLSAACDYEPYESTRAFYRGRGFAELIELDIWGPENPATLFVRPL